MLVVWRNNCIFVRALKYISFVFLLNLGKPES